MIDDHGFYNVYEDEDQNIDPPRGQLDDNIGI